jgi:hypothetical protein
MNETELPFFKGPSLERMIDCLLERREENHTYVQEFFKNHDWPDGPKGQPTEDVIEYLDFLEHWGMAVMRDLNILKTAKEELSMAGDPCRGFTEWRVRELEDEQEAA